MQIRLTLLLFAVLISSVKSQNFWSPSGSVGGTAFTFSVDSAGSIFAGTFNAIYKSTDDGDTWQKKATGGQYTNYIWFVLNKQGTMFCATHSSNIMKSTDNGENWTSFNSIGYPDQRPMIFLDNGDLLAMPYHRGLFRSTNNGQSWTKDSLGIENVGYINTIVTDKNGDLLIGTDNFIYKSTDNGHSWFPMPFDSACPNVTALLIAKDGTIYAGSKSYYCGIFKSTDNGLSWDSAFSGLRKEYYDYVFQIVESPNGRLFASTNGDGVYMSRDKGASAEKISSGIPDSIVFHWGIFISPGGHLYVGTQKGIFRSNEIVTDVTEYDNGVSRLVPEIVSERMDFSSFGDAGTATIFTLAGVKTASFNINENPSPDISCLETGVYLYSVVSDSKITRGKFVKIR